MEAFPRLLYKILNLKQGDFIGKRNNIDHMHYMLSVAVIVAMLQCYPYHAYHEDGVVIGFDANLSIIHAQHLYLHSNVA